ncbi:MAG: hypothetical protein ACYTFW_12475, partial [Planctomycetota bacterium]
DLCHKRHYKYTAANIREALNILADEGEIIVDVPRDRRMKGDKVTLGDKRIITFTCRKGHA